MLTSRSNPVLTQKILIRKCKIDKCSRSRQVGSCGKSNFCKVHEVFIFLVKLKYSLKKLFGNLSSGFAVLQRESGEFFTLKDLRNFMNFLMIPFLLDDLQNVFEVLGKKHCNKNITVIKIADIKQTMKSKEYHEIIDVEIRIILEVITSSIKLNGIKNVIASLDDDHNGIIGVLDFVRTFRIRETQAQLFFKHVFHQNFTTVHKLIALFPENNIEMYLDFSEVDSDRMLSHFFSERNRKSPLLEQRSAQISPKHSQNLIESLKIALKSTYNTFEEAFFAFANSKHNLGYFQVQRLLTSLRLVNHEKACRTVLEFFSENSKITLQKFKEFWLGRKDICKYETCGKTSKNIHGYCESHANIEKNKALALLEKVRSQTALWKSPRAIGVFYRDLEKASRKNKLVLLKTQLKQILPISDLPNTNLSSLQSILGKLN